MHETLTTGIMIPSGANSDSSKNVDIEISVFDIIPIFHHHGTHLMQIVSILKFNRRHLILEIIWDL